MRYAFRWNTRNFGPVYLKSLDAYAAGRQVQDGFTANPDEALLFGSVKEAVAGIQQRALNIDDVNSKLELVQAERGGVIVGRAL